MSEKVTSQTQQTVEAAARKMVDEQVERMEAWMADLSRLEKQSLEGATKAIDESAKLWKESIGYAAKLQTEWRNLWLQSAKKATEMMSAQKGA